MKNSETTFFVDVPLYSVMRIRVERSAPTSKEQVIQSITPEELSLAIPVTNWGCVKYSWQKFLDSESEPIEFSKGKPPMSMLEEALGFSFFR